MAKTAQVIASATLGALIVLCVAWELWLAPLRPGGSLLALKALPLALPIPGVFSGKRYTYQWSSMLILAYFAEGVTRALGGAADYPRFSRLLEIVLSAGLLRRRRQLRALDSSSRLAAA